jgi:hypothetical protein
MQLFIETFSEFLLKNNEFLVADLMIEKQPRVLAGCWLGVGCSLQILEEAEFFKERPKRRN